MLSLRGQALIATHTMDNDDEDVRTVWAVLDHTKDATTVFCLNRPAEEEVDIDVRRRIPDIPEGIRLLRGGTMDGFEKQLIFIHRDPMKLDPSIEFAPKFRISMKHEHIFELHDSHASNCRIALGFDTWDPHQLEEEIRDGYWTLRNINHVGSTFFKVEPHELWARLQAH